MRAIKQAFDPLGIMNPGKMLNDGEILTTDPPLSDIP